MSDSRSVSSSRPGMPRIEAEAGYYFVNFSLLREDDKLNTVEREAVLTVIRQGHGNRYDLHAVVVMPTHVHLILQAAVGGAPVEGPRP